MRFLHKAAVILTLLTLPSGQAANASTVAYWRFEEGTAGSPVPSQPFQVPDASGHSNTLQSYAPSASPNYTSDTPGGLLNPVTPNAVAADLSAGGQALYTNGVELESHSFNQFTIEASVKFTTLNTQAFLDKDGSGYPFDGFPGVFFGLQNGNGERALYLVVHQADGHYVEIIGKSKINTGQWYNLAAVSDGTTLSLYSQTTPAGPYNLEGSKPFAGGMYAINGSWVLGRGMYGGSPGYAFNGELDEVRISDTALTESQLLFHYTNPVPQAAVLTAAGGYNTAFLAWTVAGGASSYTVKRSASATGTYTTLAAGLTGQTYTDLTAAGGKTYYYTVTGVNSFGSGPASNVASAAPVAAYNPVSYWRFEEGTAGSTVPAQPFQVPDSSGNNNTVQTYADYTAPAYVTDNPGPVYNPFAANTLGLSFATDPNFSNRALYTNGAEIESHAFNQFTLEASVNFSDLSTQAFLDKDGSGYPFDGFPGVFFGLQNGSGEDVLYLVVHQADGHYVEVFGTTKINTGQWYNAAAVSDGLNLSLYLQTTPGGAYNLEGSAPFAGGMYGINGSWVLGRGMYNGSPGYQYNGELDEVRISDIALAPSQLLFTPHGAAVTGRIALEGVSDLSKITAASLNDTYHIEFRTPGTTTAIKSADVKLTPVGTGSPYGTFSVSGVAAGTYDIAIKGKKSLRIVVPNAAITGSTSTLANVTLPSGDATNDNIVDIGDFGVLVNAYGGDVAIAGSGYNAAADFNDDGVVDIGDFGILVNEYGNSGAP